MMWKLSVDLPLITQYMYHLVLRTLTIFDIVEVCGQVVIDNNRSSLDKTQSDTWEKNAWIKFNWIIRKPNKI